LSAVDDERAAEDVIFDILVENSRRDDAKARHIIFRRCVVIEGSGRLEIRVAAADGLVGVVDRLTAGRRAELRADDAGGNRRTQHERLGDIVTQMRAGEGVGIFMVGISQNIGAVLQESVVFELRVRRFDANASLQMNLPEIDGVKAVGRIDRLVGTEVGLSAAAKVNRFALAVKSARERPIFGNGPS